MKYSAIAFELILLGLITYLMLFTPSCLIKKKEDKLIMVDTIVDYPDPIIRRPGSNVMSFRKGVVVIAGKDTATYYPGDTVRIKFPKGYTVTKIQNAENVNIGPNN